MLKARNLFLSQLYELYHGKVKILPGKHEEEDLAEIAGHSAEEIAAEEPAAAVDPAESEESAE